ncbi:Protein 21.1 [Giardia lamblia P15]|uniref:Protein 21.1 n=1 Tax=Giardia intestinalis (strain P15) TaxID=658858 RepID=E1F211_GIAIA|nr:Protein 21.1 [Giardia lamblia P15]
MSEESALAERFRSSLASGNSEELVQICEEAAKSKVCLSAPERIVTENATPRLSPETLKILFTNIAAGNYEACKQQDDIVICSWQGRTPLMCAAEHGHVDLAKLFLSQLGCVSEDTRRCTALQLALINGHSALFVYLLPESGIRGIYGRTMLHMAASMGLSVWLSNFTVYLGEADDDGNTALMLAAMNGHTACVEQLLAELGETNANGDTALLLAMRARERSCVKLLEGEIGISGVTSLMYTASLGDAPTLSQFLKERKAVALMGRQDNQGRTALTYAMEAGIPIDTSIPLLAKEENIPAADGLLPIHIAVRRGFSDYLRRLRHQLVVPDNTGNYPLSVAARYCWCDSIVELLDLKENDDPESAPIHLNPVILGAAIDAAIKHICRLALPILVSHVIKHSLLERVSVQGRTGIPVLSPTDLMKSAAKGNTHGVLANLHKMNCIYEDKTALMIAATGGHHECVKLLLCELGIVGSNGLTALDYACEHGHLTCIKQLSPEYSLMLGKPLYHATNGDYEWIKEHAKPVYRSTTLSRTPLMCAAACGQDRVVAELTEQVGMVDALGYTALGIAVQRDQTSVIPILISELSLSQANGMSALMVACKYGCYNSAEALFPLYYPSTKADELTDSDTAQAPGHVRRDADGKTALMYATISRKRLLVHMLLGAEGGLQDNTGMTALMYAVRYGCKECYELLITCRAEVKHRNNERETALMLAIKHKRDLAVKLLGPIEGTERDGDSKTALILATERNRKKYIRELCPYGEGLIDEHGNSALSIAVKNGLVTITRCLVHSSSECAVVKRITAVLESNTQNSKRTADCLKILNEHADI